MFSKTKSSSKKKNKTNITISEPRPSSFKGGCEFCHKRTCQAVHEDEQAELESQKFAELFNQIIKQKLQEKKERELLKLRDSKEEEEEEQEYKKKRSPKRIVLFDIVDEIHFWSRQIQEHNKYFRLGLKVPKLEKQASLLEQAWGEFATQFIDAPLAKAGIPKTKHKVFLSEEELEIVGDLPRVAYENLELLFEIQKKFQIKLLEVEEKGTWFGFIHPAYIAHTTRELKYFRAKVSTKPMTIDEEVSFWNLTNAEHASLSSVLLDPSPINWKNIKKLKKFAKAFKSLQPDWMNEEEATFIGLSLQEGDKLDLDAAIEEAKELHKENQLLKEKLDMSKKNHETLVHSIIHPELANHIVREDLRGLKTMMFIQKVRGS